MCYPSESSLAYTHDFKAKGKAEAEAKVNGKLKNKLLENAFS